jgi:hypothetical protein
VGIESTVDPGGDIGGIAPVPVADGVRKVSGLGEAPVSRTLEDANVVVPWCIPVPEGM